MIVANGVFVEVFGRTLKMIQDSVKLYAEASFDCVGILLCLRVNTQHQLIMQKRRIPALDQFLNSITLLLWPRFQSIIDMHVESVRKHTSGGFFSSVDVQPHFIVKRFAELSLTILTLNEGYNDQMLDTR